MSMDMPFGFDVELDPELFTLDRLDALYRRGASDGKAGAQDADPGFERNEDPDVIPLQEPVADAVAKRPLHVWYTNVTEWAPEYVELRDRVLDTAGVDRTQKLYHLVTNIRIFSPDGPVALHADPESQINCGVGGRNIWHFSWPSGLSLVEQENLLHGGHFLKWRELPVLNTFDLRPGQACYAPSRFPHWIEHPGPDLAVSFEVGYFTAQDVRDRKVYDVNWLLRKLPVVQPRPPREFPAKDRRKQIVFDAISMVTRRGTEFRGA
jgi:hypothetical protein